MSDNGYSCPFCGEPSTFVKRTINYPESIVRYRTCLTCGFSHTTIENLLMLLPVRKNKVEMRETQKALKISKESHRLRQTYA